MQTTLPVFSLDNLVLLHQRYSTCLERNVLLGWLCSTHTFSLKKKIFILFFMLSVSHEIISTSEENVLRNISGDTFIDEENK